MSPAEEKGTLDWARGYDESGNLISAKDPKGQVTVYAYGILNREESRTYTQHASPRELPSLDAIASEYDENGNLKKVTETKLTTSGPVEEVTLREFDGLDRLKVEVRYDGKRTEYRYDAKGNRVEVKDAEGVATGYTYDALDRLKTATMPEGVSAYAWWPDGLAKGVTLPNGLTERRCYDAAGRLSRIVLGKGSVTDTCVATSPITELDYEYDGNGNRLLQKERRTSPSSQLLGAVERTEYGYDNLDRLVGVRYPDETATLYRLDEVGNRVGEKRAASSKVLALTVAAFAALAPADATADVQATFNRADWLLSLSDAKDASRNVAYAYDLNGNVVRKSSAAGEREFRWDCRDTLTAVLENGAVLGRYDYDRNLQRTKRITASENVEYVLDDKFVLLEADGSQTGHPATRRYHYGTQPLAVTSAGVTSFLSNDALGSITDATSTAGAVTSSRQYDAWGRYRNGTAPSATEPKLGYTGHQFDLETGLVYARARYYDPDTGRFLSRDTFEGSLNDAPSLHRYAYAHGNPLTYVDPTGRCVNFFANDVLSFANCIESAKVLGGFAVGVGETAAHLVAAPGMLTYNVTGAALYAMTGESQYAAQAQSFNEGLAGVVEAVSDPLQAAKNIGLGFKQQVAGIGTAIEQGDLYGAGRGTGSLTAEVALVVEGGVRGVGAARSIARIGDDIADAALAGFQQGASEVAATSARLTASNAGTASSAVVLARSSVSPVKQVVEVPTGGTAKVAARAPLSPEPMPGASGGIGVKKLTVPGQDGNAVAKSSGVNPSDHLS